MAVDAKHPEWQDRADEWREMRVTSRGAKAVKEAGEDFLPMPSGFRVQADSGRAMYGAYQKRAQFPEIVAPTIRGMVGVIHRTEAQIAGCDARDMGARHVGRARTRGVPPPHHRRAAADWPVLDPG
jgi:hypothetical protein